MSRFSSSYLLTGPRYIGAWDDEDWRVGYTAQLVEGGGGGPYWLISRPAEDNGDPVPLIFPIDGLDTERVVDSIILLVATMLGRPDTKSSLVSLGIVENREGGSLVVRDWKVSRSALEPIIADVKESTRLGIVTLDQPSLVTDEVVDALRSLGFDVDVFR